MPVSRGKYHCHCKEYCDFRKPIIIPEKMKTMSFESYRVNSHNMHAHQKAQEFGKGGKSLYLFGSPGNGKSHLLMSAYKKALTTLCPHFVVFANVSRLLKIDRYEFETREEAEDRMLVNLSSKLFVFLDDFCAENVTGRTAEFIYLMLNDAIENGRPRFFFTSNQSTIDINDNISSRIASRVNGLCGKENIIKVEGDDWRIK